MSIFKIPKKLFCTTVTGIALFALIIISSPLIFLYKYFVVLLAKIFRPDLGSIFSPQSRFFYPSTFPGVNTLVQFKQSGKLNYARSVNRYAKKTILRKDESGKFIYPEFQQFPTMWLGYPFWKNEVAFNVEDHFRHSTVENINHLQPHINKTLMIPFHPKLSPWIIEFIEVREAPNRFHFCLYFHHSLGDGSSICRALLNSTDEEASVLDVEGRMKARIGISMFSAQQLRRTFLSYFRVVGKMMESDVGPWDTTGIVGSRHFGITKVISLALLKTIGRNYNVSISAVVLGLITGAIRRKMMRDEVSIPQELCCFFPLFTPDHPKGLTNKMYLLDLVLPVGTPEIAQRLKFLDDQIEEERKNKSILILDCFLSFCGSVPYWLVSRNYPATGISIFPAPTAQISVCECPVEDMIYGMNGNQGYAFVVNIMSYDGKFRFWISADAKICSSQEDVEDVSLQIMEELKQLPL